MLSGSDLAVRSGKRHRFGACDMRVGRWRDTQIERPILNLKLVWYILTIVVFTISHYKPNHRWRKLPVLSIAICIYTRKSIDFSPYQQQIIYLDTVAISQHLLLYRPMMGWSLTPTGPTNSGAVARFQARHCGRVG